MNFSKKELKNWFNEYNSLYFEGKLKLPVFKWLNSTSINGSYVYDDNGTDSIWISRWHQNWNDDFIKKVLIHEMAHQYVYHFLTKAKYHIFQHGLCFQYMRLKLKLLYNITI